MIQLRTSDTQIFRSYEILDGKTVDLPPNLDAFRRAQRTVEQTKDQGELEF